MEEVVIKPEAFYGDIVYSYSEGKLESWEINKVEAHWRQYVSNRYGEVYYIYTLSSIGEKRKELEVNKLGEIYFKSKEDLLAHILSTIKLTNF